jgi:hypothetical protein
MSPTFDLISQALRTKLQRDGLASLTDAEWHLLRVSQWVSACVDYSMTRTLADAPLSEVLAVANGLDAMGATIAAEHLRSAVETLINVNDLDLGGERQAAIARVARDLELMVARSRAELEQIVIGFAFSQQDEALVA